MGSGFAERVENEPHKKKWNEEEIVAILCCCECCHFPNTMLISMKALKHFFSSPLILLPTTDFSRLLIQPDDKFHMMENMGNVLCSIQIRRNEKKERLMLHACIHTVVEKRHRKARYESSREDVLPLAHWRETSRTNMKFHALFNFCVNE